MKKYSGGFTLIELLVVIAIIGILAAIVLSSLNNAKFKAKDSKVQGQLSNIRSQAELYASSHNNSYSLACTTDSSGDGINTLLVASASGNALGDLTSTINTDSVTAGSWNVVTCHDSNRVWAVEAPMHDSSAATPSMWCVDSTGASKAENANLSDGTGGTAATEYACP